MPLTRRIRFRTMGVVSEGGRAILLFGWDGGGNVPPFLALGKRLVRRGHRVRMVGTETMADSVQAAGIEFSPFTRPPSWAPRPGQALEDEMDNLALHLLGPELGEELLGAAKEFGPDVLVIDSMAGGALSAAEHLGLPTAVLVHLRARFHYDARGGSSLASQSAKESLNRQRIRLGLAPLPVEIGWWGELWQRAGNVYIASLPELEGPGDPLPPSFAYVGGVFDPEPASLPSDVAELARGRDGPFVVTSLSTTYMHQETQLDAAVQAFDGLRAVVTVGGGIDSQGLRASSQVLIRTWLPHESLLDYADVVVTHAGHGTVIAALAAGVPLVCMPMGRDQHSNAEEVVRTSTGVCIDPGADARQLRAAVDQVLAEPTYKTNAEKLADSMRRLGGGERLADDIEALVSIGRAKSTVSTHGKEL